MNSRRSERFIRDAMAQQRNGRARPRCLEWDVARGAVPSVWGGRPGGEVDEAEILRRKTEANRRPSEEVRRFKLFERCMWVATHYRVIGERRAHRRKMQRRLLAWGAAALGEMRRAEEAVAEAESQPRVSRSGRPLSGPARFSPNGGVMDGTVTRKYAARTPEVQRQWEVLYGKQQRACAST